MKICTSCDKRFASPQWLCPYCGWSPEQQNGYLVFESSSARAEEEYDAKLFAQLAEVEARNFWFESRNRLLIWALRTYFPGASSLLEVGCGTGFVLSAFRNHLPQLSLSGCDVHAEALLFAKSRVPDAALYLMDAGRISFEEEFDIIGAFDVIEHMAEDDVGLSRMFKATRRGGGIMLTVPQHQFLWSVSDEHARHKRRYSRKELVGKVCGAGFQIERVTSFVSVLLPAMLAARWEKKRRRRPQDPMEELKIRGPVNAFLMNALSVERFIIRHGLSFPLGGSLLVVARRP